MTDEQQRAETEKLITELRGLASVHFSHRDQLKLELFIGRWRFECKASDALRAAMRADGGTFQSVCQELGFPS